MRKYQTSIIIFLIFGIATLLFFVNQKETETSKGKLIQHFRGAEVINPIEGPKFDSNWFDAKYQVVAYTQSIGEYSIITYDWNPYFDNNPEFEFIFYYSGSDKDKLVNWMTETDFRRPVLYDPEKVFYKENVIGDTKTIVFNVKDGVKQFLENPSFPNYQEFLDELKEK